MEWAFVKYQLDINWKLRVGRVLTPVFMDSENNFVNYSMSVVRPDTTLHGIYPLYNHDGIDLTYKTALGDGTFKVNGYFGKTVLYLSNTTQYDAPQIIGAVASWENEHLLVRANFTSTNTHYGGTALSELPALRGALTKAAGIGCVGCDNLVGKIDALHNFHDRTLELGTRYSDNDTVIWSEFCASEFAPAASQSKRIALLLGVSQTYDVYTPYMTISRSYFYDTAAPPVAQSVINKIPNIQLQNAIEIANSTVASKDNSRHLISIGARWDFAKNQSMKIDVTRVHLNKTDQSSPFNFPYLPNLTGRAANFNVLTLNWNFFF